MLLFTPSRLLKHPIKLQEQCALAAKVLCVVLVTAAPFNAGHGEKYAETF
jgi:hypothetical protein